VLAQARVPVLPDDTPEQLAERVLQVEHRLLAATVLAAAAAGRPVQLKESGVGSQESGVGCRESGDTSNESRANSHESGVRSRLPAPDS
jgi:hypothetical protein